MYVLRVALLSILVAVIILVQANNVTAIDPLGKFSITGGAEREQGFPAGGRATAELLGVLPLGQTFGLQGLGHYVGGRGSRFGLSLGPIMGWNTGKAGIFVNYQHRTLDNFNLVHIRPAVALYFGQANVNLWYSHPVSSPHRTRSTVLYGTNKLQGTVSYFPGSDLASWLRKDNVELTFGAQANTFAGAGKSKLDGAGVGPVFGLAFMPIQNIVVNLFRGTVDNRSRYKIESGIQVFFSKDTPSLKDLRRRYLEPNQDGEGTGGKRRRRITVSAPPTTSTFFLFGSLRK